MTTSKTRRPSDVSTRTAKPLSNKRPKPTQDSKKVRKVSPALRRAQSATAPAVVRDNLPIDWHDLLSKPPSGPDWLLKPFIARGKIVSLYSKPKAGKSLVILNLLHRVLTGTHLDGSPAETSTVLYLDHENDLLDLHDRLHAMGAEGHHLDNLVYLQFPDIEPLDTRQGGAQLLALANFYQPDLIVLDTISRFVEGGENESSTAINLYNHSLAGMKKRGVAVLRLDHTGRDETRGARGSSAKASDVDAGWSLKHDAATNTRTLTRDFVRNTNGPDALTLRVEGDPLNHLLIDTQADPLERLVQELDRLEVDVSKGRDAARNVLTAQGVPASNALLSKALKVRKERWSAGASS